MHDGGGLRTVVFLKGCPLRCLWCSTPESQPAHPQRGYSRAKCVLCGRCVERCPNGALSVNGERVVIDGEKCRNCLGCVEICPSSAMLSYGYRATAAQIVREIAKDEVFYFHSGGGVTISGGEPLTQPAFVREILLGCRERGIHRAIETSFCTPWEAAEGVLPLLNLLYVDLKHALPKEHERVVGVSNETILENIRRADAHPGEFEMVIRMPLVPGVNDADEAIIAAAELIRGLNRVRTVELLAYHRLGTETYRNLDLPYPLAEIAVPEQSYMESKARLLKAHGGEIAVLINNVPFEDK
ncbi:glycyl-radical enzyme activating protein [Synergistaceae bacterium OttesenSCG-928-I11]|nr:glycyl-radical enzyme activating protein [Synergistaceae bacterium OttesenSCG-928-I11]